jgi:predicted acyltransferase
MASSKVKQASDDFDSAPTRLYSLDALRGFDMFWIMGADEILHSLRDTTHSAFWTVLGNQFEHPLWNGFHCYDLIFPLFLFMAGVSTPFSVGRELEKGKTHGQLLWRVIKRALILILLGLIVNNGLQLPVVFPIFFVLLAIFVIDRQSRWGVKSTLSAVIAAAIVVVVLTAAYFIYYDVAGQGPFLQVADIRFPSVLGRIGLAYMFANIIYLYSKEMWQMVWFWVFIIGYYLLLKFTSAPGFHPGDLTPQGNFASYVDRTILPGHLYVPYPGTKINMHDPEGLFSTIPAISTGILGILTGTLLKNKELTQRMKTIRMVLFGALFIFLSLLWNFDFPINKNLWSSSFVLLVGGISLLLMALFYYIIDVLGYKKWAFFFKVIGMNSILIYISGHFISWTATNNDSFQWLGQWIGNPYNAVVLAITVVLIKWLFLRYLYEKKTFLRV